MPRSWNLSFVGLIVAALFLLALTSPSPSGAQPKSAKPKSGLAAKAAKEPKKSADDADDDEPKDDDQPQGEKKEQEDEKDEDVIAPVDNVAAFMRLKLEHAQHVLEGIAIEDFDMIAKHSQQINLLTKDEMWQVMHTESYLQFSDDFSRSARRITEAAREKNIDGAALAYMQLTLGCVNCHKYTRDARMARRERVDSERRQ